jgi:hypothetical protein
MGGFSQSIQSFRRPLLCLIGAAKSCPPSFVTAFSLARKYDGQIDFRGGVNRGIKADSFFYYYLAIKENTI